jgi:hypothetical protein
VEASLLPSEGLRKLCEKAVVVAVRRTEPQCEAITKEFSIFYGNPAVAIVLDSKGETLACWDADGVLPDCTSESVTRFPSRFVQKLEESLARTESTQALERRYAGRMTEEAAFEALVRRHKEAPAVHPLRNLCLKVEETPGLPHQIQARARMARFIVEAGMFARDYEKEIREGEELLFEFAAHPEAPQLVEPLTLLYTGAYLFDFPARSSAALARLDQRARTLRDPTALRQRMMDLSKQVEYWKGRFERELKDSDEKCRGLASARLADGETALRILSKPEYADDREVQLVPRAVRGKGEGPKR